jgi:hypothetical protein
MVYQPSDRDVQRLCRIAMRLFAIVAILCPANPASAGVWLQCFQQWHWDTGQVQDLPAAIYHWDEPTNNWYAYDPSTRVLDGIDVTVLKTQIILQRSFGFDGAGHTTQTRVALDRRTLILAGLYTVRISNDIRRAEITGTCDRIRPLPVQKNVI